MHGQVRCDVRHIMAELGEADRARRKHTHVPQRRTRGRDTDHRERQLIHRAQLARQGIIGGLHELEAMHARVLCVGARSERPRYVRVPRRQRIARKADPLRTHMVRERMTQDAPRQCIALRQRGHRPHDTL